MKHLATLMLFATPFFSCLDDEKRVQSPTDTPRMEKDVVLTMQIPGAYLPVTYSYSETDENDIRTVDALVFRIDEAGNEYFHKHIAVSAVNRNPGNAQNIQLRMEHVDARVIVLANVRRLFTGEMKEQLRTDSIAADATKETVMKRFVFDMTDPFGKRQEAFPMYGESEIIRSADKDAKEIRMIRSITRIDVINSLLDKRLTIDSVFLVNTKDKGFVAPRFEQKGAIIESTNLPPAAKPNKTVFGYKFFPNAGTASPTMEREIYITEDAQDSDTPTVVVVKIIAEGRPPQFYRVDMLDKNGDLIPVRRNHRYRINIMKITGIGYPTAAAAASMSKLSISSFVETNELGISSIVFNDLYKLGVSAADVSLKAGEDAYSLKVHTTYSGWKAVWEGDEPGDWLNLTPSSGITLNIKATPNTTGKTRTGKIKLTAGTLQIEVRVAQSF
jgi:hypothetical protein